MTPKRRTGWIGIDVGTSSVKIVQLKRNRNRVRLSGSTIIPRRDNWPTTDLPSESPRSSADEIHAASSLLSSIRGKRAAAMLPMAVCDIFSFDQPTARQSDQEHYFRKSIELATQRSAANLEYDYWDAESDPKSSAPPKTNVLTVNSGWTDQICDDVIKSGWWCQAVDGLPLALARAVSMVEPSKPDTPIAVLDWGYGRATFCIVSDHRPVYIRCLKESSLSLILDSLIENLGITSEEAQRVLQDFGIAKSNDKESHFACELIEELIAPHLLQLEEEIQKTISHLKGLRRTIVPKKLYVFGGGATISGLAKHLTQRLRLPTKIWQFGEETIDDSDQMHVPSCLFGPAIALSALAWRSS